MDPKAIVIYDSDCGFCRWCVAVLLSAAGRGRPSPPNLPMRWGRSAAIGALRPLPLGTAEADRLLADLSEEQRNASWHLVYADGTRASAGAALAPALYARFPRATERGYRWVADHRGLLGRFVPARARRWADRVIAAHGGPPSQ